MIRRRGMTLLEVLISVTLVALLSTAMLYSIRTGLGSVESIERRLTNVRKSEGTQRILEQQFVGFLPVFAPCGGINGPPSAFFQGSPVVLRMVTSYSLDEGARGRPRIVEYFILPTPDGAGVRLVVNELPFFSPRHAGLLCSPPTGDAPILGFPPPQSSPRSFILADRLSRVEFSYQEALPTEPFEIWRTQWIRPDAFPAAIRIQMTPLAVDAARPAPLPFVARLLVNRTAMEGYEY